MRLFPDDDLQDVIDKGPLPTDEILELINEYHDTGDIEIKRKLIEHNLKLVLKVLDGYNIPHVPADDMFHYGILGLDEAIERFDMGKETKFSTYAYIWIKKKINRNMAKNEHLLKMPIYLLESTIKQDYKKFKKTHDSEKIGEFLEEYPKYDDYEKENIRKFLHQSISSINIYDEWDIHYTQEDKRAKNFGLLDNVRDSVLRLFSLLLLQLDQLNSLIDISYMYSLDKDILELYLYQYLNDLKSSYE